MTNKHLSSEKHAEQLDDLRARMLAKSSKAPVSPTFAAAVGGLAAMIVHLHRGIRTLAKAGLHVPATVLLRSMIEGTISMLDMVKKGESEAERFFASALFARLRLYNAAIASAKTPDERRQYEERKKEWRDLMNMLGLVVGEHLVRDKNVAARVDIREAAPRLGLSDALRAYERYSAFAHCTAVAVETFLVIDDDPGKVTFRLLPDYEEADRILAEANTYYFRVLKTLNEVFALGADDALAELAPPGLT